MRICKPQRREIVPEEIMAAPFEVGLGLAWVFEPEVDGVPETVLLLPLALVIAVTLALTLDIVDRAESDVCVATVAILVWPTALAGPVPSSPSVAASTLITLAMETKIDFTSSGRAVAVAADWNLLFAPWINGVTWLYAGPRLPSDRTSGSVM